MMFVFGNNVPSVLLMSLVLLASAQRTSNNLSRDTDFQELARQNKITKQILEVFIQKKLGLAGRHHARPPSIHEILPVKKKTDERNMRETVDQEEQQNQQQESQDYAEDDNLQTVESEQIDSYYSDGMY